MNWFLIDIVNIFFYLDLDICPSGTMTYGIDALNNKSTAAILPLNTALAKFDISTKFAKNMLPYISTIFIYNIKTWWKAATMVHNIHTLLRRPTKSKPIQNTPIFQDTDIYSTTRRECHNSQTLILLKNADWKHWI